MKNQLNLDQPLWKLTVGEFLELQNEQAAGGCHQTQESVPAKRYVYGLSGIRNLLNVSHVTAQRLKDGILKPAVRQCGRKIIVDAEMALELFGGKK